MESIISLFVIVLILIIVLKHPKKDYHSHWAQLLPNFKFSTKEFYELVQKEMSSHEIEGLSFGEVSLKTASIVSSSRYYLRVRWKDYYYDLCFAPFGDGCFVSWWLIFEVTSGEEFLSRLPFIGGWIQRWFFQKTFYQIDTASMFMTYSHNSVLSVIDEITKNTVVRLIEDQRKPDLNNIFKR